MNNAQYRPDVVQARDEKGRSMYRAAIRDIDHRVIWIHPSLVSHTAAMLIAQYKVREIYKNPTSKLYK